MSTTSNLGLTKPAPSTQHWGDALNTNFDIIDAEYAALMNQVSLLRNKLGQLGIYASDPTYTEYIYFVLNASNNVTKIYVVSSADSSKISIYEEGAYKNMNTIMDYSMFTVCMRNAYDTANSTATNVQFNNQTWSHNDIAVKCTRYNAADHSNSPQLIRMHQTIGGYYQPTRYSAEATTKYPVLSYERKNALETTEQYTGPALYLKPTSVNGNTIHFRYTQVVPGSVTIESILSESPTVAVAYPQVTMEAVTLGTTDNDAIIKYASGSNIIEVSTKIAASDYIVLYANFYVGNTLYHMGYSCSEVSGKYKIYFDSDYFDVGTRFKVVVGYAPKTQT